MTDYMFDREKEVVCQVRSESMWHSQIEYGQGSEVRGYDISYQPEANFVGLSQTWSTVQSIDTGDTDPALIYWSDADPFWKWIGYPSDFYEIARNKLDHITKQPIEPNAHDANLLIKLYDAYCRWYVGLNVEAESTPVEQKKTPL